MSHEVDTIHPDLVILGSEALSESCLPGKAGAGGSLPLGSGLSASSSMGLAMAKLLTDVPLLICKTSSLGTTRPRT